jgi:hypothetical protein
LHIGACEKGVLTKFIDFAGSLYPDSLLPEPQAIAKTNGNKAKTSTGSGTRAAEGTDGVKEGGGSGDSDDEEEAHDLGGVCGTCGKELALLPVSKVPKQGWFCDWPGHEGRNVFKNSDPVYGCPTALKCDFCVCQSCMDTIEAARRLQAEADDDAREWEKYTMPKGAAQSTRSEAYYCEVKSVALQQRKDEHDTVLHWRVTFSARGDMSDGPLPDPESSTLIINDNTLLPVQVKVYIRDDFQIQGDLFFDVPVEDFVNVTKEPTFTFASSDYSPATLLSIDNGNDDDDDASFPMCDNGHCMLVYETENECRRCDADVGKCVLRWSCQACVGDYCLSCAPVPVLDLTCPKDEDHKLERLTARPSEYFFKRTKCDECGRVDLPSDPEFYHCKACSYDLCIMCATKQVAESKDMPIGII